MPVPLAPISLASPPSQQALPGMRVQGFSLSPTDSGHHLLHVGATLDFILPHSPLHLWNCCRHSPKHPLPHHFRCRKRDPRLAHLNGHRPHDLPRPAPQLWWAHLICARARYLPCSVVLSRQWNPLHCQSHQEKTIRMLQQQQQQQQSDSSSSSRSTATATRTTSACCCQLYGSCELPLLRRCSTERLKFLLLDRQMGGHFFFLFSRSRDWPPPHLHNHPPVASPVLFFYLPLSISSICCCCRCVFFSFGSECRVIATLFFSVFMRASFFSSPFPFPFSPIHSPQIHPSMDL